MHTVLNRTILEGMRTPKQRKSTLMWYCQIPSTGMWQYFPAIIEKRQNVFQARHGFVMHNDELKEYPKGRYVLRSFEAGTGRKIYTPLPKEKQNPVLAVFEWQKSMKLAIRAASEQRAEVRAGKPHKHGSLKSAVDHYLSDCHKRELHETCEQMEHTLNEFMASKVGKETPILSAVTQATLLKYRAHLKTLGNSPRTQRNKLTRILTWLKSSGVDVTAFNRKEVLPRIVQGDPHTYDHAEVKAIIEASSKLKGPKKSLHIAILLMLKLGLREREAVCSTFDGIDFKHATYTVRAKPEYGFTPKNFKAREIPIEPGLLEELQTWRKLHPRAKLIVPTRTQKPNRKLLLSLQRFVAKLGIDGRFDLHSFRRTFATMCLQSGVDLRTVQIWMGHGSVVTTQKYLSHAKGKDAQAKITTVNFGD